jgi:hypothetical protein
LLHHSAHTHTNRSPPRPLGVLVRYYAVRNGQVWDVTAADPRLLVYLKSYRNTVCLALPCLALPCLALPCLALPCVAHCCAHGHSAPRTTVSALLRRASRIDTVGIPQQQHYIPHGTVGAQARVATVECWCGARAGPCAKALVRQAEVPSGRAQLQYPLEHPRYPRVPQSTAEYRRVPQGTAEYRRVPWSLCSHSAGPSNAA